MATVQIDTVIRHLRQAVLRQDGAGRTDGQLLASFVEQKDEAAFEALVHRHGPMVFGVCRRVAGDHHDAEDAFQATFLVLARKALTVQPRERVANWLHGVALRTALKAKALTAKRRKREKQVLAMPEPAVVPQDHGRDLQPLLDQELHGLPENYRLPILCCDLEGRTIKEAAQRLGWPQGTVAGRLARGRKLLAKRLASRGVVLPAGSLAAVALPTMASAGVPTSLVRCTVKAAAMLAAGQVAVVGTVPAKVVSLTEGVLKAMMLSKLKSTMVGLLLVALVCGVAGTIYQTQAAEQPTKEQTPGTVVDTPQAIRPPEHRPWPEYVITSRLLEAGAGRPKVLLCPKLTVDNGQLAHLDIEDGPQNLLAKVVEDEKVKIGTSYDVRVTRMGEKKVRLFCSFRKNDIEKSSVNEIRVLGNTVQTIKVVELHKPVKIFLQKDARGSAQRWVEITVDAAPVPELPVPPAATSHRGVHQTRGKK